MSSDINVFCLSPKTDRDIDNVLAFIDDGKLNAWIAGGYLTEDDVCEFEGAVHRFCDVIEQLEAYIAVTLPLLHKVTPQKGDAQEGFFTLFGLFRSPLSKVDLEQPRKMLEGVEDVRAVLAKHTFLFRDGHKRHEADVIAGRVRRSSKLMEMRPFERCVKALCNHMEGMHRTLEFLAYSAKHLEYAARDSHNDVKNDVDQYVEHLTNIRRCLGK